MRRIITAVLIVATVILVPWMAWARPNGGIGHREPTDFTGASYGSQSRMATKPDVWGVTAPQLVPAPRPAAPAPAAPVSIRSTSAVTEEVLGDEGGRLPAGPAGPAGPARPAGPAGPAR